MSKESSQYKCEFSDTDARTYSIFIFSNYVFMKRWMDITVKQLYQFKKNSLFIKEVQVLSV